MTEPTWSTAPYTLHVNGDPSALAAAASADGARVLRWSLAGIRDDRELDASAAEVFELPYPSAGPAGLIDLLSDPDRWRSQDAPFEAFLVGVADVPAVTGVLEQKNVGLDEFGRLEWSRGDISAVPVVVHG
jgi:hypothetical protein